MPMLNKEFTINLSEPIKAGKVTIGYFDGIHPSIVAVTRSDKIFVHNPHNRSLSNPSGSDQQSYNSSSKENASGLRLAQYNTSTVVNDLNFLNINQTITCIVAGSISSNSLIGAKDSSDEANSGTKSSQFKKNDSQNKMSIRSNKNQITMNNDILIVGTKTSIHAYDILNNTDLYYKEIPDGANALVIGEFGSGQNRISSGNLALIGGNCAIHGFDRDGQDSYWMVTGDNITAMALVDIDNDGQNELVVGSLDCEIQVFKKDAIIAELSETDCVTHICSLGPKLFAYALANGTVGVYQNKERIWRIKSKNQAMTLFGADINNNGQMELLTGWSNGKLDIRIAHTGEVLYRENYKCSVAGIMMADYNVDGKPELIVCTVEGDVYGYHLENQEERLQQVNLNIEQDTIRDLMKKKQTLMQELRNYEENARIQNLADPLVINKGKVLTEHGDHFGAIPANTKLKSSLIMQSCSVEGDSPSDYIELRLETTNNTRIRAAIIFAEGIFKHESIVIYPIEQEVSNIIRVPLRPPKDVPVDMHVKALVGYRSSQHYHVFELSRRLPRFSMYSFVKSTYFNNKNESLSNSPVETEKLSKMPPLSAISNGQRQKENNLSTKKKTINKLLTVKPNEFNDDFDDEDLGIDSGQNYNDDDDNYNDIYNYVDGQSNKYYLGITEEEYENFKMKNDDVGSNVFDDQDEQTNRSNFKSPSAQSSRIQDVTVNPIEVHQSDSFVVIHLQEQISNIVEWMAMNFLVDFPTEEINEEERRFEFISLRDKNSLIFDLHRSNKQTSPSSSAIKATSSMKKQQQRNRPFINDDNNNSDYYQDDDSLNNDNERNEDYYGIPSETGKSGSQSRTGGGDLMITIVSIYTNSIEVAGNCIQSMAEHFKIQNLPCHRANFPDEIHKLKQLVDRVEEIQNVRQHLVVEVADNANMIRASVVQAEDARLTEEYQQLKQIYNDLAMLNRDIMREYKIRCQNHQDLVDSLKQINIIIQRASNLRIGSFKTSFINSCREAIKLKNFAQLFKIINED